MSGHWRIGRHYGIHVYEGDRPVATFQRARDAEQAVAAVKALAELEAAADHYESHGLVRQAAAMRFAASYLAVLRAELADR